MFNGNPNTLMHEVVFEKFKPFCPMLYVLTHWGRVTHICVRKLTVIASDNGLSPERRQAIIWTNARIMLIGPLGTNFSEIFIEIQTFSLKKIRLKMSSAKCCSFRVGLNVLKTVHHTRCLISHPGCVVQVCQRLSLPQPDSNNGSILVTSLIARFMGPTWAHLGPTGPRWAPCWPHELCYLGSITW